MKKLFRLTLLLCLFHLVISQKIQAQCTGFTCMSSSVTMIGQTFPCIERFVFANDTLRVIPIDKNGNEVTAEEVSVFRIIKKECQWYPGTMDGSAVYRLMQIDEDGLVEYSTVTLTINSKKGQIVLKFDNEKPRTFEITLE